jgi:hypothetical protein
MDLHETVSEIFQNLAKKLMEPNLDSDIIDTCIRDAKQKVLCVCAMQQCMEDKDTDLLVSLKGVPIFLSQDDANMLTF